MGRIATRPRSLSDPNVLASGDPFEGFEITSFVGSDYVGSEVSLLLGGLVGWVGSWVGGEGERLIFGFITAFCSCYLTCLSTDRILRIDPVFSGGIDVLYCIDWIGMMGFFVFARKWSGEDLGRNTSP